MRLRRGDKGRRGAGAYVATAYCDGHTIDLVALRKYAEDGRPCATDDSVTAIEAEECPACRPQYRAADEAELVVARDEDGWLACGCCGTRWGVEEKGRGWVAIVDNGLAVVDEMEPIPVGAMIDSASFQVSPVDPVGGPTDVLRAELSAFARTEEAGISDESVIEDLVEGLASAYGGHARAEAEVYRVLADSGLDGEGVDRWRAEAVVTLHDIRKLFGGIG